MTSFEIIDDAHSLSALKQEWDDLLTASTADTIFLRWQWVKSWLSVHSNDVQIRVVVCRDAKGRAIALAPLYLSPYYLLGRQVGRCLRVLGDHDSASEYSAVMFRSDCAHQATSALRDALRQMSSEWEFIWLPNIATWDKALISSMTLLIEAPLWSRSRKRIFSSADISGGMDSYLMRMSSQRRQHVRRISNRLLRTGSVKSVSSRTTDCDLESAMDSLFSLHTKRWRSVGQEGAFESRPKLKEFLDCFAPLAVRNNWLRLFVLEINGNAVAVQLGFRYGDKFLQIQEGYDPNGPKGAATALRVHVIKSCIDEGISEYDFLGGFSEHKRRWGAETRHGSDLIIGNPRARSRLIKHSQLWPTGRYLRV